jgi:hypothetical protein
MHSAEELRSSSFQIALDGREVALTELYVEAVLEPEAQLAEPRAGDEPSRAAEVGAGRAGEVDPAIRREVREGRARLFEDGLPVETYRRIDLDEALALLAPARERVAAA